jgi:cell division protein FtsZ
MGLSRREFLALCGALPGVALTVSGGLRGALAEVPAPPPVIKVLGVGGCGCEAVRHMARAGLEGVGFIGADTDGYTLGHFPGEGTALYLSRTLTGLEETEPEIGEMAALEGRKQIVEAVRGADALILVAGMGGSTGTGAAPVIAGMARELGILTVAVASPAYAFEGLHCRRLSDYGLRALRAGVGEGAWVDPEAAEAAIASGARFGTVIAVPSDELLTLLKGRSSLWDIFEASNNVIQTVVDGMAQTIRQAAPGRSTPRFAFGVSCVAEVYQRLLREPETLLAFAEPFDGVG